MIPILFAPSATSFSTLGLGKLADAISCNVVEERNGEYELTMEYPVEGKRYKDITHSAIIYAVPRSGANPQPFRIYRITKPINGVITIYAQHISYQMSDIPVQPFTASSIAECLIRLKANAMETCPFTFWTDKSTQANYKQAVPESMRARLGGVAGSVLDVYGGEYEFDGYTVKLHGSRGMDRGVVLRYGKNIVDINQDENIADTITGIVPVWISAEGDECQYAPAVYSEYANNFPYKRTRVVDFSSEYESKPTVEQLTARAESYIAANHIGVPKVGIDVKFVALWETEEYKHIAPLERVYLCDTVTVEFEKLGISVSAKVTKTDYNVLLDRYNEIFLGENTRSLASTIAGISSDTETIKKDGVNKTALQQAIDEATAMITGESGGYLVINRNANGEPYELLIMDTDDITTATKVWRWNQAGLGYSSTGYAGPYGLAMTQNGAIVADFIKSGTIAANLVKILGTDRFFWDADNINIVKNSNESIRIGRYDGTNYGIGFTEDGGSTYTTAIGFDGINASALKTGTLDADRIGASTITLAKMASSALAGLANSEQVIYKSQAESATAPGATTTWITDTTGSQNTWTTVRPEYSTSYPKLYVALQRKDAAGTVTCTTPALDKTTTVIDGGHIITNTITSEKIVTGSIELSKLKASTSNGDGITKISGSGIEVSHTISNVSYKTTIKADGLKILDANNSLIGGVYIPTGQSTVRVGSSSLCNPAYPNFSVQLDRFWSGESMSYFYGMVLYRKNTKVCGLCVEDDDDVSTGMLYNYNDDGEAISRIIEVARAWADYDPSQFVMDGADDTGSTARLIYAHGRANVSSSEYRYINYSAYRFTETPTVVAQYSQTGSNISGDVGALKIYNKTTTGFNAIIGGNTSQPDRDIDWIAIGVGYGYAQSDD